MSKVLRQQLIDTACDMNTSGLNQGTAGNLSVRFESGMLITPSGMDYHCLQLDDIVWMDFDGNHESHRKPSSEWRFHAAIYQNRTEAQAVLHAHPRYCTTLACLEREIPAFHYMVAIAGGKNIRCAPYATFGTPALSESVVTAMQNRKACLMAHHGMTCFDDNLTRVLALAIEVENLAAVYSGILAIGTAEVLGDTEMAIVIQKFAGYGVQD